MVINGKVYRRFINTFHPIPPNFSMLGFLLIKCRVPFVNETDLFLLFSIFLEVHIVIGNSPVVGS